MIAVTPLPLVVAFLGSQHWAVTLLKHNVEPMRYNLMQAQCVLADDRKIMVEPHVCVQAVDSIDWREGFCRRDIGWRAIQRLQGS